MNISRRHSQILALASVLAFAVAASASAAPPAPTGISLQADARAAGTPLKHFWSNTVGAGRANEGLRASWQEQLKVAADEAGFRYVRFHGIFHDDMFVYREIGGKPVYNFQYTDDLFDRMLALNVRPFVELAFSPSDMATTKDTAFWWHGNGSPPKDYGKWAELVRRFAQHCIDRYGIGEVRSWYFEVWNEPNLSKPFFLGTQAQYFDLYKTTALALKTVDPKLRVGGPATSNFILENQDPTKPGLGTAKSEEEADRNWRPVWVADFLKFCNENSLPLDFVSTHPYPQDFALEVGGHLRRRADSTHDDLLFLRTMIGASPYPKAEIHLTEWNSSPSSRDFSHDSLAEAAFVAKCNLESLGLVDSLSYWTFTDVFEEGGAGNTIFHGGFGMINYQGIEKPSFHAYRMMNRLGDELLQQTPGGIVSRSSATGKMVALAYNYPVEEKVALPFSGSMAAADAIVKSGSPRTLDIVLTGLSPDAVFEIETLDRTHGNAVAAWQEMGAPPTPTREQTDLLRTLAKATRKEVLHPDSSGRLVLHRELDAWSLLLVRQM